MFSVNELIKATGARPLKAKPGAKVAGISIDTRTLKPAHAFIAIKGVNFDGQDFINQAIAKGARCIISSQPASFPLPRDINYLLVKDTQIALGDIAAYYRRRFAIPVVAITGSSGKTTTKEMCQQALSRRYNVLKNEGTKNNQIGVPLTLLNLNASHDLAIVELGTNHPGEIARLSAIAQPSVGIITNIGPAHLEFLGSVNGVYKEKFALVEALKSPALTFLNTDDDCLRKHALKKTADRVCVGFGIYNRGDFYASDIRSAKGKIQFLVNKAYPYMLRTLGLHNVYNALAAIALARILGLGHEEISAQLARFDFLAQRLAVISYRKTTFIDDTYNSNPVSLHQALQSLDKCQARGRKILVMGDMLELGPRSRVFHEEAGRHAVAVCDAIVAVGLLSRSAADAAAACGFKTSQIFTCATSAQAKDILFKRLELTQGDIVLVKGSRGMQMEDIFKT